MNNAYGPSQYNNYDKSKSSYTPGRPPQYGAQNQNPGYGYPPEKLPVNSFAIASLVVSLLGGCCANGIAGIVFGIKARREIAENPYQSGAGMALAGIIISSIVIALNVIIGFIWLIMYISAGS